MRCVFALMCLVLFVAPRATAADASAERRAKSNLNMALMLRADGREELARARLELIVRNWPDTKAAQRARDYLDGKEVEPEAEIGASVAFLDLSDPTPPPYTYPTRTRDRSPGDVGTPWGAFGTSVGSSRSTSGTRRGSSQSPASPFLGYYPGSPMLPPLDYSKPVFVKGYFRGNGTYVRPHTRSLPHR